MENAAMTNRIRQISALGQAIWLDFISRDLLRSGDFQKLVDEGLTGVTSNPTIFQKAIAAGSAYDADIARLARSKPRAAEIFEALAVQDVGEAADTLRKVYDETHGRDGFASIEVNPKLAYDTAASIAEGRRLFGSLKRPNVMIKIPATPEGLPAISGLLSEGINVNVTLIFSLDMYDRVMQAYIEGLRKFLSGGGAPERLASVASFFVSRVDTLVDKALQAKIDGGAHELEGLLGKAAIANAKLAYQRFKNIFEGETFAELRGKGVRPQRPLWASTSTKNPEYSDTMYIDPLIGVNTVNTVPPQTLEAIRTKANVAQTIEQDVDAARTTLARLKEAGIDMHAVTDQLTRDGVKSFSDSFEQLLKDVEAKRARLTQAA